MDKSTAQRLVRNTLKAPFDRKRYHGLVNELCNGFDEAKAHNMTVPEAFVLRTEMVTGEEMVTAPSLSVARAVRV
jgi:hypothetical protein